MNSIKERVLDLGIRLGINFEERDPSNSYSWDGKTIASINNDSSLLHEIAHYLVCKTIDPMRLEIEEYGLGPGPDTSDYRLPDRKYREPLSHAESSTEEHYASALGILLEEYLGLNWEKTSIEHCWLSNGDLRDAQREVLHCLPDWLQKEVCNYLC